ncbi:GDSL-like Lipase/Acylhydrolase family protein [Haloechinothrix alba]|uniref:GDSL-like Lipase/Acylhydrolase family protein n=1 Tax=Haloechinothrix alba TaxID=664784 RepID=A0A238VUG2_9PSEU|nr:SGNH/GDSL hydrolase family protein [Haloechinothrix alba]SNR37962.1 GDSL-like Lipase/Acylhydrolase family protein [Haloechinothrix alba]
MPERPACSPQPATGHPHHAGRAGGFAFPRRSRAPMLLRLMLVIALATGTFTGAERHAHADEVSYVALGDSYSSGVGTRTYHDSDDGCYRSPAGYPALLSAELGGGLDLQACSGAGVSAVRANQLDSLDATTTHVTVSVGGNDAGFASVLTACARPWPYTCWDEIDSANTVITESLPGRLDTLYAEIAERAPNATVVAVGYPRLFNGEQCNLAAQITPSEQAELNATADLLAEVTGELAAAHGFGFADPRAAFLGHAVCDSAEWINGVSYPILESYHPNRTGYARGYVPVVAERFAAGVPAA